MGGPTHKWVGPPIVTHGTNKGGGLLQGGGMGEQCNPLSRGEPIGWGAIKTHCTAMSPVAANRRLKAIIYVMVIDALVPWEAEEHGFVLSVIFM